MTEILDQAPPSTEEIRTRVLKKMEDRARARVDKMFLANEVLGCYFQPDVHTSLFKCFPTFDDKKTLFHQSEIKDRMILWPRGHYKTTAAKVEIIQMILNFPNIKIMIMRGTVESSQEWLSEILMYFTGEAEGSRLHELFPEFCGTKKELKATSKRFVVKNRTTKQEREGTVQVASPGMQLAGRHFDAGFFDDLVNDKNFQKETQLEKIRKAFWAFEPLVQNGFRYVTGTRYAFGDLYEDILKKNKGNWTISVKNCWSDNQRGVRFPQRQITHLGVEKMIGFTRPGLLAVQVNDPVMFASQYLNQPISVSRTHFSQELMISSVILPHMAPPLSQAVLFVDLSGGDTIKNDDSVVLAGKVDGQANMYVTDVRGGQWLPSITATAVIEMALKHRPLKIMIEKSNSGVHFEALLQALCREKGIVLPIDFIKVDTKLDAKTIRISGLSALMQIGRLKFFMGLTNWDKITEQFTTFTGSKHRHDDYPDTIALMCGFFGKTVPPPVAPTSANRMVALLDRNSQQSEIMNILNQEPVSNDGDQSMGSDFSC